MRSALSSRRSGVGMTGELGFNNTYALVMRRAEAERLGVHTISDLRKHPELKFGLTHEFLDRRDGWRPLARTLSTADAQCCPESITVSVTQRCGMVRSTSRMRTRPTRRSARTIWSRWKTIFISSRNTKRSFSIVWTSARSARGLAKTRRHARRGADDSTERGSGANKKLRAGRFTCISADEHNLASANRSRTNSSAGPRDISNWPAFRFFCRSSSAFRSASWPAAAAQSATPFSPVTGTVQTIPSLALLALARARSIFRNQRAHRHRRAFSLRTAADRAQHRHRFAGHRAADARIRDRAWVSNQARVSGKFICRSRRARFSPESKRARSSTSAPPRSPRSSAPADLGEPILSGLNLNDHATILQGAIPAAILALLVQWFFDLLDRVLIPKGLRL